ncbi:MAG: thiol-disulfide oxidoreductase DCC family protein [Roseobacter sp.]
METGTPEETAVLYNADCPVCSFEIDHYAAYSSEKTLGIAFDDLNDATKLAPWGVDSDTAARRLHVLKNGALLTGIPAFIALWEDMPKYHWLARLVSRPGIYQTACFGYDVILAPLIYRWHLRRQRRSANL